MHILVINFQLEGVTEAEYADLCMELAPSFAEVPGLLRKYWLASSETGTYGGVYVWRDRQALADFQTSELFNAVASHPNLANITATDFGILEGPTDITRGLI